TAAFDAIEGVELARELATLVMIAAVGWLAGRGALDRLAWTAVIFGAWDIVYYLGLRLAIGWPPSLETWDVLFLVPIPWVGPVWAPMVVSVALIGFGLAAARRLRAGRPIVVGPVRALAGLAGGGLVIASFLVDTSRILAGESSTWTGWPLFGAGMVLATAATVSALGGRPSAPAPAASAFSMEPEADPRSAHRTDPPIPTGGRQHG
ncbi:MAG: hypothetical protein Q7S35_02010, partial [Candidatus Limnocylindrales bacterium]|nr:hypothetical protein [Candidatus Limnocylindrales bacterium]